MGRRADKDLIEEMSKLLSSKDGGSGFEYSRKDIEDAISTLKDSESELKSLIESRKDALAERDRRSGGVTSLKNHLSQIQEELEKAEKDLADEKGKAGGGDPDEIDNLEKEIRRLKDNETEAKKDLKKAEKKLKKAEDDLEKARDDVRSAEKKRNRDRSELREINDEVGTRKVPQWEKWVAWSKSLYESLEAVPSLIRSLNKPFAETSAAASKFTKAMGGSAAAMEQLRNSTNVNVRKNKLGIKYNISTPELIKAQQDYTQAVGRNVRIGNAGQENLAAMHAIMGGKENELAAALENFGVSINGTAKHAGKLFKQASDYGISFEKYTENVKQNISIAQNYTFRNGLKGLESMAAKATAIRLDMQQVASLAEKVSSVEGAIEVSSKLQVLGGPFAQVADPLGMLNEGLNDMEGLYDRITKMVGNMGNFNKETGEVQVSAFNKRRIKAAADAMGMDYSKLMESVNTQAKRKEVDRYINQSSRLASLDEKKKELLRNTATFENGRAGVTINGKFRELNQLSDTDYKQLIQETQSQSDDVKQIATDLRSLIDMQEGFGKQKDSVQASWFKWLGQWSTKFMGFLGTITPLLYSMVAINGAIMTASVLGRIIPHFYFGKGALDRFGGKGLSLFRANNAVGGTAAKGGWLRNIGAKIFRANNAVGGTAAKGGWLRNIGAKIFRSNNAVAKGGKEIVTATGKRYTVNAAGQVLNAQNKVMTGAVKKNILASAEKAAAKETERAAGKGVFKYGLKRSGKRAAIKVLGKNGAKAASKLIKPQAMGPGAIIGAAGMVGNILTDRAIQNGKMQAGSAGHFAAKMGSQAAEFAGMGSIFGPVGMAVGAAIGASVGAVQAARAGKAANATATLTKMGIVDAYHRDKEGNIIDKKSNIERLEEIKEKFSMNDKNMAKLDKALSGRKLNKNLKRKLEESEEGQQILDEIEKKQQERKDAKWEKKKKRAELKAIKRGGESKISGKINTANFVVTTANFSGKAFRNITNGEEQNGEQSAKRRDLSAFGKRMLAVSTLGVSPINPVSVSLLGKILKRSKQNSVVPIGQPYGRGISENDNPSTIESANITIKEGRIGGEINHNTESVSKFKQETWASPITKTNENYVIKKGNDDFGSEKVKKELTNIAKNETAKEKKYYDNFSSNNNSESNSINGPIDINLNGTLKLTDYTGDKIDIVKYLNDHPKELNSLIELIAEKSMSARRGAGLGGMFRNALNINK